MLLIRQLIQILIILSFITPIWTILYGGIPQLLTLFFLGLLSLDLVKQIVEGNHLFSVGILLILQDLLHGLTNLGRESAIIPGHIPFANERLSFRVFYSTLSYIDSPPSLIAKVVVTFSISRHRLLIGRK